MNHAAKLEGRLSIEIGAFNRLTRVLKIKFDEKDWAKLEEGRMQCLTDAVSDSRGRAG